ncbi:MAG: dolichol-P-mannose synthesis [Watsoniomyces obsoletus]|nr:MAG: dolichol-P-mannose synthesis [Watsoniomyces obsoletus]
MGDDTPRDAHGKKAASSSDHSNKPSNEHQAHSRQPSQSRLEETRYDAEEAREAALRAELEGVRNINRVVEGVVDSLERAKQNMEVVSRTVASASTLLNTWIRILSQTEHNQRLILNPAWQGATRDVAELEHELMMRQQAEQRREMEEQRREAAARKAEEEEAARRRAESMGTRGGTRGSRGRSRSVVRGTTSGLRYPGSASQTTRGPGRGSSVPARSSSGIRRGIGSSRARGRGQLSENG